MKMNSRRHQELPIVQYNSEWREGGAAQGKRDLISGNDNDYTLGAWHVECSTEVNDQGRFVPQRI